MSEPQPTLPGFREGAVLAGKYRIERTLGVGGTAMVVAARHLQLDAPVAIKFLLPQTLANAEAVARFAFEAQAAVKVKNEHVARVFDVGALDDGAPYMVMEYLDGTNLEAWLASRGPLPALQAIELVLQACEAVAEAHALGIVHRDLKPANLFLMRRPDGGLSVKVLDFGISKSTTPASSEQRLTRPQALVGTPLYMSPEQLQSSATTDTRSDIWALGVILFELLTGEAPFTGDSVPQVALEVVSSPTPSLRAKRPELPEELEQVIARCLEKDPEHRFANVAEFATALAKYGPRPASLSSLQRIRGVMRRAGAVGSPDGGEPEQVAKTAKAAWRAPTPKAWSPHTTARSLRSKTWLGWIAAVSMLLVGIGLGAYALWLRSTPALPSAPALLNSAAIHAALPAVPALNLPAAAPPPAQPEPSEAEPAQAPSLPAASSELNAEPAEAIRARPTSRSIPIRPRRSAYVAPAPAAPAQAVPSVRLAQPEPTAAASSSVYDDRK